MLVGARYLAFMKLISSVWPECGRSGVQIPTVTNLSFLIRYTPSLLNSHGCRVRRSLHLQTGLHQQWWRLPMSKKIAREGRQLIRKTSGLSQKRDFFVKSPRCSRWQTINSLSKGTLHTSEACRRKAVCK